MLLTPYLQVLGISFNARFVFVTMVAHGIFGVGLGLAASVSRGGVGQAKLPRWHERACERRSALEIDCAFV